MPPSGLQWPATPWPLERTATGWPLSRATLTAAATSALPDGRAISAGRRSIMLL
jgi:hypothetical protein